MVFSNLMINMISAGAWDYLGMLMANRTYIELLSWFPEEFRKPAFRGKISLWFQKLASIQPRTGLGKV